ncbi:helix-turn-helix domain-containing protein [Deinococcus apachensis]|uniref:helix-turn-helix domain-containing protein n=1 Tax=Deinococcus apachensis TaxID=309886 RepID=UPI00036CC98B|nr:helix-turn-helix domain-containing protein [Deinococcus apachensis]
MTLSHSTAIANQLPPAPLDLGAGCFIDTATVAEFLGCTARTVVNLIRRGHLPAVRLGEGRTAYRVPVAALLEFVTRFGTHAPATVAASENPDELLEFTPEPVMLATRRTSDGLLIVTPLQPRIEPSGD